MAAKWTARDIPDQTGRIAVVTGANSGLGKSIARELARAGASVTIAVRNTDKGEQAAADIRRDVASADLSVQRLDLADLASVRSFAEAFAAEHDHLDVLVNNAGIMAPPRQADRRRVREPDRHQPPRPLRADRAAAADAAGGAGTPGRDDVERGALDRQDAL